MKDEVKEALMDTAREMTDEIKQRLSPQQKDDVDVVMNFLSRFQEKAGEVMLMSIAGKAFFSQIALRTGEKTKVADIMGKLALDIAGALEAFNGAIESETLESIQDEIKKKAN